MLKWYNVYKFPNGLIWYGQGAYSKDQAERFAVTAIANGCKLLYRIHVRMK